MPLFPETKMADVGKLISLGNLLVRKFTWFVLTTTSATWFRHAILEPTAWQELPIYTLVFQELILCISTHRDNTPSYTATYKDNSLFPFWLTETTHSHTHTHTHTLSYILTSRSQSHEMYTLCNYFLPYSTFTVILAPASKTTTEISSNHRKKQITNMGEDMFLLTYIIKIL